MLSVPAVNAQGHKETRRPGRYTRKRGETVADDPIEQLTLREMVTQSERLCRELTEHLELGFLPKLQDLGRLVRPTPTGSFATDIEDITVRHGVAGVLESEAFTGQLYHKFSRYCEAIDRAVSRIVTGN